MQNENLEETSASRSAGATEDPPPTRARPRLGRSLVIGLVILIVIAGLGGLGGYQSAVADRVAAATFETAVELHKQFLRAEQDYQSGNFDIARQRIEYVIRHNPAFPGAEELLTRILIAMQSTATPTLVPTATLTPTVDLRSIEEVFQQAIAHRNGKNWTLLLESLDTIRQQNPEFRAVEVDGLYYVAYRERGILRIQSEGNLEGGIFDLDRAEAFGPLDIEAQNYREWASWYITGASFWDLSWEQVVTYFEYVVPSVPNLRDSSGFTAANRLATAQVEYSYDLIRQAELLLEQRAWCEANDTFILAGQYAPLNPTAQPTAEYATSKCEHDSAEDD